MRIAANSFVVMIMLIGCEARRATVAPAAAEEPAESALRAGLLARGAAAWERGMCSKCHGEEGRGGARAPDLTDDQWLHCDGSVEGILQVLRRGVPKSELKDSTRPFAMNPVSNLVPDADDLAALAAYVMSRQDRP